MIPSSILVRRDFRLQVYSISPPFGFLTAANSKLNFSEFTFILSGVKIVRQGACEYGTPILLENSSSAFGKSGLIHSFEERTSFQILDERPT
jgi:hypothetical protein